mgnify:CR=1 FL=1
MNDNIYRVIFSNEANNCVEKGQATLEVTTAPKAGTLSGNTTICNTKTTTISSNGDSGGSYTSSNTSVATVNETTGEVTAVAAGTTTIKYTVTATSHCTTNAEATITVTVNEPPVAPTIQTINQPGCLVTTGSVVLANLPETGEWTINPGGITGTGTTTTISELEIGTYNYTVTNTNGCTSVASLDIVIENNDYLEGDYDGDGITNGQEEIDGTDPKNDCDSIGGNPLATSDCDGDGLTNEEEAILGTDPNNLDSDNDGISDNQEFEDGTDPNDPCSSIGGTPPTSANCDIEIENDLVDPNTNNGTFIIRNIESFPNNTVEVYNRWGVKVFETVGYDNQNNVFRRISEGRLSIYTNEELPVGVYYYIINYNNNGEAKTKIGYLYINR